MIKYMLIDQIVDNIKLTQNLTCIYIYILIEIWHVY